MFEQYTYEKLLQDVLNNAPEGIDTRQGSIFYDAVAGALLIVAKFYTDLERVAKDSTILTAADEMLDTRAAEYNVYRHKATPAKYKAIFEGMTPKIGERFFYDGIYFKVIYDETAEIYCFEAEKPGTSGNIIYAGTPAIPVRYIDGLISSTFGEIYENGSDPETDQSLRTRLLDKIAHPAENGNRQHYKVWCESIDGIGKARIIPLWNGPNTVMAVLIDSSGFPCSPTKVEEVQNYVDPAKKGIHWIVEGESYLIGDGLGDGVANIGAHFTAISAEALNVKVSFKAELNSGATKESAREAAEEAIKKYIQDLVLSEENEERVTVRIAAVGALINALPQIGDYSELKLNDNAENIITDVRHVPVLTEVEIE